MPPNLLSLRTDRPRSFDSKVSKHKHAYNHNYTCNYPYDHNENYDSNNNDDDHTNDYTQTSPSTVSTSTQLSPRALHGRLNAIMRCDYFWQLFNQAIVFLICAHSNIIAR